MTGARARMVQTDDGRDYAVEFFCPGCHTTHQVPFKGGAHPRAEITGWEWNRSLELPTISPSILVHETKRISVHGKLLQPRCHSFVVNGQIQFCGDCGHELSGKTLDLQELPWPEDAE